MEFRDLKAQYKALKQQIDAGIAEVINKSSFISGEKVQQLESRLADYVGVKYCVSCASGTDALLMPLMAWGVGEGDAVFVPDFTFFATAEVVARLGATPVFVDIESTTFNMSPDCLEQTIEKIEAQNRLKPKAVIPVDIFGQPADYERIEKIAKKHGLLLLEDAAQGFGGALNEKRAGSFGDAAATSFFPAKPLGCYGDGGAVFTNDGKLAQYLRSAAVHGKGVDKYDNVIIGLNSRLDTLQAAILIPKLDALTSFELDNVNNAAQRYNKILDGHVGIPRIAPGFYSSWAQYSILLKDDTQRQKVRSALNAQGIPTNIYYRKPLHAQTAFCYLSGDDTMFPVAADICKRVISLPMHPYLDFETSLFIGNALIKSL